MEEQNMGTDDMTNLLGTVVVLGVAKKMIDHDDYHEKRRKKIKAKKKNNSLYW